MTNDIIFQILDWNYYNEETNDGKQYIIRLFGKTDQNKTIYVKVLNFTPYFYIKINENWTNSMLEQTINYIKTKVLIKDNGSWINCGNGLKKYIVEKKYKFKEFTNFEKFTFIKLIFSDLNSMNGWICFFRKKQIIPALGKRPVKFELYESNINPYLRCMHIRNLEAVGWVKISKDKIGFLSDDISICDINITTKWHNLERMENKNISSFIIAAFDIECTSEDGSFPQAKRDGDQIIQIGTTFSKFGENECYYQHIITLGSCDQIDGATVISCNNEKDLLIEWNNMIRKMNPDIITGYNIFGFDYKYMYDRSIKLGVNIEFSKLSRINGEKSEFKEKSLSSSALGNNIMTYYDMTGRVNIDLMKVVQRDYNLASYKLDYVASYFIKENINNMVHDINNNNTLIYTKNTNDIKKGQYISIYYNDGITENSHMEGKKFQIIEYNNDIITVNGLIKLDILGKLNGFLPIKYYLI